MTKKEAKENLLASLREQGIDYSHEGDIVEFEGVVVSFDGVYIVIRYGKERVYYPLATLSHITIMEREFWISDIKDCKFSVTCF